MSHRIIVCSAALTAVVMNIFAQKNIERDLQSFSQDIKDVKSLVLQGNKVRTIIYNTGSISNPGVQGNVLDLVWNGLGYAYEIGFLAGSKVPINTSGDSVKIIIDGFGTASRSTADGDFSPDALSKWGWLPLPGNAKEGQNEVANNQNPLTWPASWGTWKGKYDQPIADVESYYVLTDSSDKEFPYYPFINDSSKQGLGLQTAVRHYLFSHPNLEDMFLTTYDIKNTGNKKLPAVVAGIHGDPHIGGPFNYNDDASYFDSIRSLIYSWDPDNKSDIPNLPPGYFGTLLTETPLNKGLTSFASLPWGGVNRPKNDSLMYDMMIPGVFTNSTFYPPVENLGDYVMLPGSGYFPLDTGSTATLGAAFLFAYDLPDLKMKADYINQTYDFLFNPRGPAISIISPSESQKIQTNSIQILWSAAFMNGDSTVTLYYSNIHNARWWNEIGTKIPNTGTYMWNLSDQPDGIFYKVHIVNNNGTTISYDSTNGYFTLNRAGDAPPEIVILSPQRNQYNGIIPVQWIAGDPDGEPVDIKVHFSENDGSTYTLLEQVNNNGVYMFDTKKVANTLSAKIKLEASANGKSSFAETKSFRIANFFFALTDTVSNKHISGRATGSVFPGVADSSALTGNKYQISFDSLNGSLRYNLKDLSTNQMKLTGERLTSITGSGTLVDGMRIWFKNDVTGLDSVRSMFITGGISNVLVNYSRPAIGIFRPAPIDLQLVFSSLDTNSTGDYISPYDTIGNQSNPFGKSVKVPFRIINLTDSTKLQAFIIERSGLKTGRWDFDEQIVILTPPEYRTVSNNTFAGVSFKKNNPFNSFSIPNGAKYNAYTTKPMTVNDIYEFTADVKYGKPTSTPKGKITPKEYSLLQNYPNPFNPETKIQFSVAFQGLTTVKIFDAIGREVKTLINEELSEGEYTEVWDGTNRFNQTVASGVYFYRLQSGSFVQTKKMILMR